MQEELCKLSFTVVTVGADAHIGPYDRPLNDNYRT